MKRIDLNEFNSGHTNYQRMVIAVGINEIMDYLEKNLPVCTGKFYKCLNCGHTIYTRDEPVCICKNPNFEVVNGQ